MLERKKLAIFDPATNLFVAKGWSNPSSIQWTDMIEDIETNNIVNLSMMMPTAMVVEVTMGLTWKPLPKNNKFVDTPIRRAILWVLRNTRADQQPQESSPASSQHLLN